MKKKEKLRGDEFISKTPTKIFEEIPTSNPFISGVCRIHGYDHLDILQNTSFSSQIFLTLTGDLPSNDAELSTFEFLLNLGIGIGIRHPACRASMNAGVSKTKIEHLLPIGLNVASGTYNGTVEVGEACKFLQKSIHKSNREILAGTASTQETTINRSNILPGFGLVFGEIDTQVQSIAKLFLNHFSPGKYFEFSSKLVESSHGKIGFLLTGLFASICLDLNLNRKVAMALFQISIAPLITALGIEKSSQPLTSMPFISDKDYEIED